MEIFDLSCEAIDILKEFGAKGSKMMISDAATGVAFAKAAMYGAAVNVKVNTKLMKDRDYAAAMNAHIEENLGKYSELADQVYDSIYNYFEN